MDLTVIIVTLVMTVLLTGLGELISLLLSERAMRKNEGKGISGYKYLYSASRSIFFIVGLLLSYYVVTTWGLLPYGTLVTDILAIFVFIIIGNLVSLIGIYLVSILQAREERR